MALITEYKCPGCGAPLAFDAESGQVKCSNCGNEYEVKDVVEAQGEAPSTSEFDWGDYESTPSTESLGEMDVYKCVSCGAEIESSD